MADPTPVSDIASEELEFRAAYERLRAQFGTKSPAELAEIKLLEELKAKHGELFTFRVDTSKGKRLIVTRAARMPEFDKYAANQFDDAKKHVAPRGLLRDVTVFPGPDELDDILEDRPGLGLTLGAKVAKNAGAAEEIEAGKF